MSNYKYPEKLNKNHNIKDFDSGYEILNNYLKRYAFQNQQRNISNTFVVEKSENVIGYYTLTFGTIAKADLPPKTTRNLPNYPIPVMILARLAVSKNEQGNGLGKGLLKDAILRTLQASEIGGIKAIMVKAKDNKAKAFYQKYDFVESPFDQLVLYLPIEFLKNTL